MFRLYWRDPRYLEHMMSMMLPAVRNVAEDKAAAAAAKRAAEALLDGAQAPDLRSQNKESDETEIEIDASQTASTEERLRTLDFEQMSTDEAAQARRMLARLTLPVKPIATRRHAPDPRGRKPDWRRSLRAAARAGGEVRALYRQTPAHPLASLGRAVRHFRIHVAIFAHGAAFRPCGCQPAGAGAGPRCMPSPSARG